MCIRIRIRIPAAKFVAFFLSGSSSAEERAGTYKSGTLSEDSLQALSCQSVG